MPILCFSFLFTGYCWIDSKSCPLSSKSCTFAWAGCHSTTSSVAGSCTSGYPAPHIYGWNTAAVCGRWILIMACGYLKEMYKSLGLWTSLAINFPSSSFLHEEFFANDLKNWYVSVAVERIRNNVVSGDVSFDISFASVLRRECEVWYLIIGLFRCFIWCFHLTHTKTHLRKDQSCNLNPSLSDFRASSPLQHVFYL